jgi:hypothetical protein
MSTGAAMIGVMADARCTCCRSTDELAAVLRRWPAGEPAGRARITARYGLCAGCVEWLTEAVNVARSPVVVATPLIGIPVGAHRALVFENQCRVCLATDVDDAFRIDCAAPAEAARAWSLPWVCPGCATWIESLAADGRSARGKAARVIDGPYGEWPHPRVRHLEAELAVRDSAALAVVVETCSAMGVHARPRKSGPPAEVLFAEVPLEKDRLPAGQTKVLLAPFYARRALLAGLDNRTIAWLTVPVTPQQVAAALGRIVREAGVRMAWDHETGLPLANVEAAGRPYLRVEPLPGADRFEIAWLLKRFTRGYDDVALFAGDIVLVPRAAPRDLPLVARRVGRLLADRCELRVVEPQGRPARFEATG